MSCTAVAGVIACSYGDQSVRLFSVPTAAHVRTRTAAPAPAVVAHSPSAVACVHDAIVRLQWGPVDPHVLFGASAGGAYAVHCAEGKGSDWARAGNVYLWTLEDDPFACVECSSDEALCGLVGASVTAPVATVRMLTPLRVVQIAPLACTAPNCRFNLQKLTATRCIEPP